MYTVRLFLMRLTPTRESRTDQNNKFTQVQLGEPMSIYWDITGAGTIQRQLWHWEQHPGMGEDSRKLQLGALHRTSRQQNMDYVGQSLSSLFGSKCCSIPWGEEPWQSLISSSVPRLGKFFFFLTSWVLRASFLLPGEGKLPCNKRIISTLSGHVTSMFTH